MGLLSLYTIKNILFVLSFIVDGKSTVPFVVFFVDITEYGAFYCFVYKILVDYAWFLVSLNKVQNMVRFSWFFF